MSELKPCPFCGSGTSKPMTSTQAGFSGVELAQTGEGWAVVHCGTCAAFGPPEREKVEAIAAWNRRAPHD